jgi:peptidoglycan-associated lipoprotein
MNSSLCIKIRFAATVLLLTFWTATGLGQSVPHYGSTGGPLEFGANYSWLHANAPAGNCGCFSASSGSGNVVLNAPHAISAVGEISGYQANRISGSTQNLTILNYLFGGRYTVSSRSRFRLYGQALFGVSHESSNYTYVQSANAFAFSLGGGAHVPVGRHLGINIVQADWLHSTLPNAANNRQNDLRLGTGIYLVLGSR